MCAHLRERTTFFVPNCISDEFLTFALFNSPGQNATLHLLTAGTRERSFSPPGRRQPHDHAQQQPTPTDMTILPAFYIIAYDLHKPEKSYPKLEAKMALFRDRFRILESTWLVKTKRDSTEIFKFLDSALDDDDHIFVTKFDRSSCDGRLSLDARIWLGKKNVGL